MDLHEYPRPANDTGLGVHWTVGFASTIGMGKIRDFWVPELKAMGIKWVKIFNHDGAIDFAELLLAEGIMPIVRIYRPSPYPSVLDIREIVHIDALIRAGVRYFEFNPEPDQDTEWKGGRVPANAIDLAVENIIANLDTILERGGMPGIPAVANGSRWDLVGKIVARGRKDIFNGPVWHAIHNYARNRPLDYPYDIGNQEGASYTPRFYQTIAVEAWGEDAWRGRALHEINRLRLDRCNPGTTIMDDNACWLAYEFIDARNRRHLGHSIPLLSTECGYLVGEDGDPRYPATTPDLHMAQTLESCRVMMGTSTRFPAAPDYYFCSAFWLLGNAVLGSASTWCENHAWYSERWGGGSLPIVRAIKAEPKVIRRWQGDVAVGARTILHGTVLHASDRRMLILEKGGIEVARAALDANSRYVIPDLPSGNYTLRVDGTSIEQPVNLTPGQESVLVNLDLAEIFALSGSTLSGKVRGGAGAVVLLLRTSDGEEWVTMAKDEGNFRFVDLPPGFYNVRVQGEGSHVSGLMLDGKNLREVELAVSGWGHTVQTLETTGSRGLSIRCRVENKVGVTVRAHNGEWQSELMQTGSAPDIGPDACEILVAEPGYYVVETTGLTNLANEPVKLEAYVNVERRSTPLVEFVYSDLEHLATDLRNSAIRGRVIGGCSPSRRLQVRLTDNQANRQEQAVTADCTFAFESLGAGQYTVELVGFADTTTRSDIALDGKNTVAIELMAPIEEAFNTASRRRAGVVTGTSVIAGSAPESGGRVAKLTDTLGNEMRQVVNLDNTFSFDGLVSGVYLLTIEGGYEQPGLIVDGESGLEVIFQTLNATWEAKVSPAGSMPGYSVVRVEVEGMRGLPVYIWKEDWEGMMRRTGSKAEYGECAAEFSPLGPGHYMIEPEGIGIWVDAELTGLEVVWIDFRRKSIPSSPNIVQPLTDRSLLAPPSSNSASNAVLSSAPQERWGQEVGNGFEENSNGNYEGGNYEGGFDEEWESMAPTPQSSQPLTYIPPATGPNVRTYTAPDGAYTGGAYTDGAYTDGAYTDGAYADEPTFDEPTFTDEGQDPFAPASGREKATGEATEEASPEAGDEWGWRSALATSNPTEFTFPSLNLGNVADDDNDDDNFEDSNFDDETSKLSTNTASAPFGQVNHTNTSNRPVRPPQTVPPVDDRSARQPLCLLIPTPVTDLEDLAALVRFVTATQSTMARAVDEVPENVHVLLIGTTGTEVWTEVERQLSERGLSSERVTKKLSEALADDLLSGL